MSRGVRRCELAAMVYKKAVRMLDLQGFYCHRRGEEAGERLRRKRRNADGDKALWESLQKALSWPQEQPPVKLEKRPAIKVLHGGRAAQVVALPPPEPEPEASVVCFWCLREIGKKKGVEGVIHGWCEEVRDAEAKRRNQKRELGKRFFAKVEEDKSTFGDLSDWYLSLSAVQKRRTHNRIKGCLAKVRKALGDRIVSTIKPLDLEEYQENRTVKGAPPETGTTTPGG